MIAAAHRGLSPTGWTAAEFDPGEHFASDYAGARAKFIAAAKRNGLHVESHVHPEARSPSGDPLSIDVAVWGDPAAQHALLISSGTHGVEGFCGSGCQVALLCDDAFVASVSRAEVAIIMVHALNPHGFAHLARTTEDNVDLNRNFGPVHNDRYRDLHALLIPERWPPTRENEAQLMAFAAREGFAAMQQAITSGQTDRADGLFFAGTRPAWSQDVLRSVLRQHARPRRRLGWIDLHTGLGPAGHGEKIHGGPDDAAMFGRARAWWGADVSSVHDGSSTSARVSGSLFGAVLDECPAVEPTAIALEFGTLPFIDVLNALRARQWLANHPEAPSLLRETILCQIRDAFYVDTPGWKAMVYAQARAAAWQATAALARHAG